MDRFLVVSSDGHCGPPANEYREYLDDAYKPAFDEHQQALRDRVAQARTTGLRGDNTEFVKRWQKLTGGDGGLLAAYDSDHRDKTLDEEGVAAEVLFPDADVLGTGKVSASPFGSGLGGGHGYDPDVAMAGARAHNRWLADFVAKSPERRVGLAVVPFLDSIDDGVAEIREMHAAGLRGVLMPTRWYDYPAYNDERYDPIWAVCEELELPVHVHSGAGPSDYSPTSRSMLGMFATEALFWGTRPLHVLLLSGAFDRHPGLRFCPTELGSAWAEDLFLKLDNKWEGTSHNTAKFADDNPFRKMVKDLPSSYLGRNIFIGCSTPGQEDMAHRTEPIDRSLMWGNDLPHPEGTFPYTKWWIRTRFADVDEQTTRAILGTNALRCYPSLDADALQPLVDEIGVTYDDIYGDNSMEAAPF